MNTDQHIPTPLLEREPTGKPLTPRQQQVLQLIAFGYGNKGVGRELGISEKTVKNHMANILEKLGAYGAAHAVYLFYICGKGH